MISRTIRMSLALLLFILTYQIGLSEVLEQSEVSFAEVAGLALRRLLELAQACGRP